MIGQYYLGQPGAGRLTEGEIHQAVAVKRLWNVDLRRQLRYYMAKNPPILESDVSNKVAVGFGRKLVKTVTGFMFKNGAITYKYPDGKGRLRDYVEDVFRCNGEQAENVALGRDQSRFGAAYEMLWVDRGDVHPRFHRVHAGQVMPIWYEQVEPRMRCAVNFYHTSDGTDHYDVYYDDVVQRFVQDGGHLLLKDESRHWFGMVPVIEYRNNEEGQGDIECVEGLIDAFDRLVSNAVDEDAKFADALLTIVNASLSDDDMDDVQSKRVLELPEGSSAAYLTKPDTYTSKKALMDKIESLIHSLSGIPKLDDRDAMAQTSGEALKYLFASFEDMVAGEKQSYFDDGLRQRLRMLCSYESWLENLGLLDEEQESAYDPSGIAIEWTRNLPAETTNIVDNAIKAAPYMSKRTMVEQLHKAGIVSSVDDEMARLDEQDAAEDGGILDEAMEAY